MSSFTTKLVVSPMEDGKSWMLQSGFSYYVSEVAPDLIYVYVKIGFVTNFASTPRIIWWLFPPWGKYGKAAVVHDWLYQKQVMTVNEYEFKVTRKEADEIFLEAMLVSKTKKWKAKVIYYAVRMTGWFVWNRYRKQIEKG